MVYPGLWTFLNLLFLVCFQFILYILSFYIFLYPFCLACLSVSCPRGCLVFPFSYV